MTIVSTTQNKLETKEDQWYHGIQWSKKRDQKEKTPQEHWNIMNIINATTCFTCGSIQRFTYLCTYDINL